MKGDNNEKKRLVSEINTFLNNFSEKDLRLVRAFSRGLSKGNQESEGK